MTKSEYYDIYKFLFLQCMHSFPKYMKAISCIRNFNCHLGLPEASMHVRLGIKL